MKICVIPPDKEEAKLGHISSGQERVARDQAALLTSLGHDVDYWTVDGSEDLSLCGFNHKILNGIKSRSSFNSRRPNPQTTKKRDWCLKNYKNYDIFLCHTDSSVFLKELTKLGVAPRIISFIHAPFAGTTWGVGFNSGQGRAKWGGATLVSVSERCKTHWNKWSKSTKIRLESPDPGKITRPDLLNSDVVFDEMITHVCCPQYKTSPENVGSYEHDNRPIILSRIAQEKKIHIAFGLNAKFVCRSDSKDYYDKIKDKLHLEKFFLNEDYHNCMKLLEKSYFLISTWKDETSGINAFEAAERGVPVILCENKDEPHASRDFLPNWAYITCEDNSQSLKAAIQKIPQSWSTAEFRKRLSSYMAENWSKDAYLVRLNSLVNEVYLKNKNKQITPMSFGLKSKKIKKIKSIN